MEMDWFSDGGRRRLTDDEIALLSQEETLVLVYLRERGPHFITDIYAALCNADHSAEAINGACWRLIDRKAVQLMPDLHLEASERVPLGTLHA